MKGGIKMENKEIHEQTNFDQKVKYFFKDKKNLTITILSIIIILMIGTYPSANDSVPTSKDLQLEEYTNLSSDLAQANEKIQALETSNQTLTKEKEELATKLNSAPSIDELQKTLEEKSHYILNLETQVGTLTAEKSQLETQNGILQQQLEEAKQTTSSSTTTSSKSAVSNPDTSATVYVTKTGDKYHRSSCSYLRNSKISINKNDAISQGYTACSRCNP